MTVRRRFAAAFVLVTSMFGLVELAMAPAVSASSVPTSAEAEMLNKVNSDRQASGLAPMGDDGAAAALARRWAKTMGDSGSLRHNPNLHSDVSREVTNQWTRVGENVGMGSSASSVYGMFMGSSAHRANIMGDYNRIGVGAYRDDAGRMWVTIVFVKGPDLAHPAAAPFPSFSEGVNRQYLDFLGRSSDLSGLGFWHSGLSGGTVDETGLVQAFLDSNEFGATASPVVRLYLAYFRRIPDYGGLTYWISEHRGGMSLTAISDQFAQSQEFRGTYGSLSDSQFVDRVYTNVLGRPADSEGQAYWTDQLRSGRLTRGGMMVGFSESAENRGGTDANVDVIVTYVGMLRRSPDQSGYAYWVDQAKKGGLRQLIGGVLGSTEYGKRTNTGAS